MPSDLHGFFETEAAISDVRKIAKPSPTEPHPVPLRDRALLRPEDAARYLSWSRSSLDRAENAALLPAAVKINGCKFHRRELLDQWVRFGCPTRECFETLIAMQKK